MATTAPVDLRSKLTGIRNEIDAKQTERAALVAAREQSKKAFEAADIPAAEMTSHSLFRDAQKAVAAVGETDDAIADLRAAERGVLEMMTGRDMPSPLAERPAGIDPGAIFNVRGLLTSDSYKRFLASGIVTSKERFQHVIGTLGTAEDAMTLLRQGSPLAAPVGSENLQGAIPADRRGIVLPNLRQLRLLDLFPTGTTESDSVDYVQVLAAPSQAAETPPGELKPEGALVTRDENAPARTIAVWMKIKRQTLADVGSLMVVIENLLRHDVRKRLERQIVRGDGDGDNLRGILETDGVGAPEPVAGDNAADAILRALTIAYLSDAEPNFTAVHPLAWESLLLMRENQAERTGAYLYGSPATPAAPTIWGTSLLNTPAVPAPSPLVGDSSGAAVLVRDGLVVRVSDSDGDDFRRNRVTLLVEMRVAFPVYRPTHFSVATVPGLPDDTPDPGSGSGS